MKVCEDSLYLGLDIGGSHVHGGIINEKGHILCEKDVKVAQKSGHEVFNLIIHEIVRPLMEAVPFPLTCLGAGVPGFVNAEDGIIFSSGVNMGDWSNFPLRDLFCDALSIPAYIDNDAHISAYGERWIGAAEGCANFAHISLGTGCGAGIFMDGRLMRGTQNRAGEIGHSLLFPKGHILCQPCVCGKEGCAETILSTRGILSLARRVCMDLPMDVPSLAFYANNGHQGALALWEHVASALAILCHNLACMLDLEKIIIGGGIAQAGPALFDPLGRLLSTSLYKDICPIIPGHLGVHAGIIGAAWFSSLRGKAVL